MPIPQKIQELANKVRSAIFGKDVREAIAEALEESGKTSAEAREITEALLDGSFDQGLLDTEIREKLQQLEQDYAPQLTQLGVQLAHVDQQLTQKAKLTLSKTPPTNPSTVDWWYEDLGETIELKGGDGGLVIGNASLDDDEKIWFKEI